MTESQIDYLWELASRDGDERELQAAFPEIDWAAAEARKEARWQERRAQQAQTPATGISLDDINAVAEEIFTKKALETLFTDSPLYERLRR